MIIDQMIKKTLSKGDREESKILYLIAITAIFIASKHEDVAHIPLEGVLMCLGKNRFSKQQVLAMERKILKVIGFNIPKVAIFEDAIEVLRY